MQARSARNPLHGGRRRKARRLRRPLGVVKARKSCPRARAREHRYPPAGSDGYFVETSAVCAGSRDPVNTLPGARREIETGRAVATQDLLFDPRRNRGGVPVESYGSSEED